MKSRRHCLGRERVKRGRTRSDPVPCPYTVLVRGDEAGAVPAGALDSFVLSVLGPTLGLDLLGTLHSMHHGREVHQEGVAHKLNDVPVMRAHRVLDDLVMHLQQPQHASFVCTHLAAKAHDVGEHNRGQTAGLGRCRLWQAL